MEIVKSSNQFWYDTIITYDPHKYMLEKNSEKIKILDKFTGLMFFGLSTYLDIFLIKQINDNEFIIIVAKPSRWSEFVFNRIYYDETKQRTKLIYQC